VDAPGGTSGELDRSARAAAGRLSMYDRRRLRRDPEVVLVEPCGYPVERTLTELDLPPRVLPG
jgi:hypothetical protein